MNKELNAANIMTKKLITFTPETQVLNAINTLISYRISGAPVLDEKGNLMGMLSEIDCMETYLQSTYHNEMGGLVKDFMSTEVKTISSSMGIVDLAEYFLETHFRRLPVVDNGKLVGQISRRDVLRAIQKLS
ncbi:MAG: CBS domain-containing protein [Candidatus Marinimicrobia bacterium]|jgi:predicted transcriptional regulator|nr:CBS domain-containing protein [Candidatus Neomarinimicrobiota bacterium]MDP6499438.1 CBS domain-containing protein [Candidatus Neomarinimicrobiota bacterium]MDP6725860.1 CBS domain-containing protein [Candidatus Neomarinimicrobiota bacterium]|tara:strand:+ start:21085 stop:21480 length:396 start_codon:yes stop_codon:yes gene_type:complete